MVISCGMTGAEAAYHLACQGKKITVFEALKPVASVAGIALLRPTGRSNNIKLRAASANLNPDCTLHIPRFKAPVPF